MIANCPTCGTHYKHDPPQVRVRGRCGRCDTTLELARLRPYRIEAVGPPSPEDVRRVAKHSPIGLDDPALATTIAYNVLRAATRKPHELAWDNVEDEDPLPPIPEMTLRGPFESLESPDSDDGFALGSERVQADEDAHETGAARGTSRSNGDATTLGLWVAAGAIAGTGASWTMGGTTMPGLSAGAALGAAAGWGWLRWMSPR